MRLVNRIWHKTDFLMTWLTFWIFPKDRLRSTYQCYNIVLYDNNQVGNMYSSQPYLCSVHRSGTDHDLSRDTPTQHIRLGLQI